MVAGVVLKLTVVAPVKLVPVMTTLAPAVPDVGEKDVIVVGTVKLLALVVVVPGTVTPT